MIRSKTEEEIIVVLDNIRSSYNVGSIFRTADAAGANKIYLCGITPYPPQHKISKVALGAENYVAWEKVPSTWRLLEKLNQKGYLIIALEQGPKARNIFKIKNFKKKKIALILGPEVRGLSSAILRRTDLQLEIPMAGKKESLNVAVAFGIAIYQLENILFSEDRRYNKEKQ